MQYMKHTKEHFFIVYFRIKTGISGGYWESGKKQDNCTDMSLPAILPNTRKVVWLYSRAANWSASTRLFIKLTGYGNYTLSQKCSNPWTTALLCNWSLITFWVMKSCRLLPHFGEEQFFHCQAGSMLLWNVGIHITDYMFHKYSLP